MENAYTGAIHALLLAALSWRSASRLLEGATQRVCAVFLLCWCNLVYTALALASFSKLDRVGLYFGLSLALALGVEAALLWRRVTPVAVERSSDTGRDSAFDRMLPRMLAGVLLAAAIGSAVICFAYVPNNWDSLTYRFSRAYFYLAQGNLLHTGNPLDPRLIFYPFNGTLLYLFLAIYRFPAQWFYVVTGFSWVFAGIGTYFVARVLGASRGGSFAAAWICLMTPSMLAQVAATNDEVLAAVPILLGLGFALRWFTTGLARYAVLAGIGVGLGFGTKLHWFFYWVFAVVAVAVVIVRAVSRPEFRSLLIRRLPALLAAGAVALPMMVAFLWCSYLSSGHITNEAYNNEILNRPFRVSLAKEKIQINTAELFLSPIPDLIPPVNRSARTAEYAAFNRFFMRCCFLDLKEVTTRSTEGYLFEGPADPDGARPTEYTVWLGFAPHLLLLVCVVAAVTRRLPWAAVFVAAAFFFWHATYAVENRFIPTASVYYSFPAVIAIAGLGPGWDFARSSRGWAARVLLSGFLAVFATDAVLAANLLEFGELRNVQFAWRRMPAPENHPAAAGVISGIQQAHRIYIPYAHWEVLYWNFMRFHPGAKYTTGLDFHPTSPDTMMLLSVAREGPIDLVPARLPAGAAGGMTYLGIADGQPIFAQGGGIETKRPNASRYTILPVTWKLNASGLTTGVATGFSRSSQQATCCIGIEGGDAVEFRYELRSSATGVHQVRDWSAPSKTDAGLQPRGEESYDTIVIDTRLAAHREQFARTIHQLNAGAYVVGKSESIQAGDQQ